MRHEQASAARFENVLRSRGDDMSRAHLIYLILVMSFCPDLTLIFVGVCWHLHTHGWGWSSDDSQCKSLDQLAMRNRDRRLRLAWLPRGSLFHASKLRGRDTILGSWSTSRNV